MILRPFIVVMLLMSMIAAKAASSAEAEAASLPGSPGASGGSSSFAPQFSKDGRWLLFQSTANNLVTNDNLEPWVNIFVKELASGEVTLVSVAASGGGGGAGDSLFPSISSNGQFVVFASVADNLVAGDTNDASDIFLRDLASGSTRLVSLTASGQIPAHPYPRVNVPLCSHPLLSDDARWIFFESIATNLVDVADTNGAIDVFARDLVTGETRLVSIDAAGSGSGNVGSELSGISSDGRFVAFVSTANNLVPGKTNTLEQVYVRDMALEVTYWAGRNASSYGSNVATICRSPVLSHDGRYVFVTEPGGFTSAEDALWQVEIPSLTSRRLHKIAFGETAAVSAGANRLVSAEFGRNSIWDWLLETNLWAGYGYQPAISADGRIVVCHSNSSVGPVVYANDVEAQTTILISIKTNGTAATAWDIGPLAISPDGRRVAFVSADSGLVANDFNGAPDVFMRDQLSQTTELISRQAEGIAAGTGVGDARIRPGCVSADGRFVVFSAYNQPSVMADTNLAADIYVKDLVGRTLILASTGSNIVFATNSIVEQPIISGNGRYAAFVQHPPSNPNSPSPAQHIYRRDLESGEMTAATYSAASPPALANGPSGNPAMSFDGQLVAFQSRATDLTTNVLSLSAYHVFMRDMTNGTTQWLGDLSKLDGASAQETLAEELQPLFTPDDRWVVFAGRRSGTGNGFEYFAFDRQQERLRALIPMPLREDATGRNRELAVCRFLYFARACELSPRSLVRRPEPGDLHELPPAGPKRGRLACGLRDAV